MTQGQVPANLRNEFYSDSEMSECVSHSMLDTNIWNLVTDSQ